MSEVQRPSAPASVSDAARGYLDAIAGTYGEVEFGDPNDHAWWS